MNLKGLYECSTDTLPILLLTWVMYRRDYSETEARKIVRQEDFRESDISPVAQTSLASSEGQSSSPGGFTSEDDGTHNVNVLHDCTNVERPWGTSTSKRPESVRDVSYDGLDEERNPWT